jgi:hypothetical protein
VSSCPCEYGDDCGEQKGRNNQNPHAEGVFSARVNEVGRDVAKQVDGDDEKQEDDEGDDGHDEAFDSKAGVVDLDTLGFLSALLKGMSIR